jgi:hypothetical protein
LVLLLETKVAVQQPLTLAFANFSEVHSSDPKRGMNSLSFSAQLRDLGLMEVHPIAASRRCALVMPQRNSEEPRSVGGLKPWAEASAQSAEKSLSSSEN